MMEYEKYEFCNAVKCKALQWLDNDQRVIQKCIIKSYGKECLHTAKEFHKWLKSEGFIIAKFIGSEESTNAPGASQCNCRAGDNFPCKFCIDESHKTIERR